MIVCLDDDDCFIFWVLVESIDVMARVRHFMSMLHPLELREVPTRVVQMMNASTSLLYLVTMAWTKSE